MLCLEQIVVTAKQRYVQSRVQYHSAIQAPLLIIMLDRMLKNKVDPSNAWNLGDVR